MKATPVPTYALYGEESAYRPEFWVHCETIAARSSHYHWEIDLHRHDSFFQILYIRTGSGDAMFADRTVALTPPCIVAVPPGVSHGYRFSRDVEGFVVTVVADRLRVTAGLSEARKGNLRQPAVVALDGDDGAYLDTTIQRIAGEFETRPGRRNDLLEAYLTAAILLMVRLAAPDVNRSADPGRARIEALQALIGSHFRDHLPAAAYARRLGLSPTHLNRIARDVTGLTVHELIMARVLDEACRALVFTPASIRQVAEGLGFADAAYFSRCFRKKTGQRPGDYRRSERLKLGEEASAPVSPGNR